MDNSLSENGGVSQWDKKVENHGKMVEHQWFFCSSNSMGRSKAKPYIYLLDGQVDEISGEKT